MTGRAKTGELLTTAVGRAALEGYRPRRMDPATWPAWREQVVAMAGAAFPDNACLARALAGDLCEVIEVAEALPGTPLAELLSEQHVRLVAHQRARRRMAPSSVNAGTTRLRCASEAALALPARGQSIPRCTMFRQQLPVLQELSGSADDWLAAAAARLLHALTGPAGIQGDCPLPPADFKRFARKARELGHDRWRWRWRDLRAEAIRQALIELGIKQIFDLRSDQVGFEEWNGALMAAGVPHCPGAPTRLGNITSPGPSPAKYAPASEWQSHQEREDKFAADIAERRAYAATRHSPLDATGCSRWICPAKAGTVGCALRKGTVTTANDLGLPVVANPPGKDDAPRMCTQATFSLRIQSPAQQRVMKLYQDLYWGSPEHRALYSKRTYVEGFFGAFKGDTAAGKNRGTSLYTGLAHESLEAAMFAVAANIRALRSWHERTGRGHRDNPILYIERHDIICAPMTIDEHQLLLELRKTNAA